MSEVISHVNLSGRLTLEFRTSAPHHGVQGVGVFGMQLDKVIFVSMLKFPEYRGRSQSVRRRHRSSKHHRVPRDDNLSFEPTTSSRAPDTSLSAKNPAGICTVTNRWRDEVQERSDTMSGYEGESILGERGWFVTAFLRWQLS